MVDDAWHGGEVVIDTDIDDAEFEAVLAAEHIDTSATMGEVDHLLPGDITRRHADTFALDAVVGSKEQMTGVGERRGECLLHKTDLHGEFFEAPQGALRFVEVVDFLLDRRLH